MKAKPNFARFDRGPVEWPTLAIAVLAYGGFVGVVMFGAVLGTVPGLLMLTFFMVLHSSFQHEVLHGHPFRNQRLNALLASVPIGLFIPYGRFRDTHLAHHYDPNLTDPYDDPESNFADPEVWARWPEWRRWLALMNNTLLGRMLVGPVMTMVPFYAADVRQMRAGERRVQLAYGLHGIGLLAVLLFWQVFAVWSLWVWLAAAYAALSVLKIRTYLEHRAHEQARGRSVIIEDTGPLSFLFLNNNLHAVHHCHPQVPWYRLRQLYRENRAGFLARNGGYVYRSYAEIFRLYACRIKDPVPHPLLPIGTGSVAPMIETEAVHPLGPLQADQRPLDPGQKEQA